MRKEIDDIKNGVTVISNADYVTKLQVEKIVGAEIKSIEENVEENVKELKTRDKTLSTRIEDLSKTVKSVVKKKLNKLDDKITQHQKIQQHEMNDIIEEQK